MSQTNFDITVVGGGPAGSTAAALLAQKGYSVLLLEKERFPRFQIGESLLPYNNDVFRELGIEDDLEAASFPRKYGATFITADGDVGHSFRFGRTLPARYASAYQVKRADFDDRLLRHARGKGVDVREAHSVTSVDLSDPARVVVTTPGGTFESRFIIDASGHGTVVGSRLGKKVESETLKKISFFAHYKSVLPDPDGRPIGDTYIVVLRNGWFWMIPVADDMVSVGLVTDRDEFKASGLTPEELLQRTIAAAPYVAQRMASAEQVGPVRARKDFTYCMSQLTGPNFALVGDAAGFIDPIFSTGVFMAMRSAQIVANATHRLLQSGDDRELQSYSRRFIAAYEKYHRFVTNFYRREFLEVFMQPGHKWGLFDVVVDILAGSVFENRRDRFKLFLFFALVKLQRWRLVAKPIAWDRLPATSRA